MRRPVHHSLLRLVALLAPLAGVALACDASSPPADSTANAPMTAADSQAAHIADVVAAGGTVDSILPIAEHLRRFRAGLPKVDSLATASPSIDALVARWARAVSARDTASLNAMVLDRREFAWLYYPGSRMSMPPYEAPPELLWGQILASSDEGARRMLARHGGRPLRVVTLSCPDSIEVEGANRVRQNCAVALRSGDTSIATHRYFGSIIERDGRFKFLSLANRL